MKNLIMAISALCITGLTLAQSNPKPAKPAESYRHHGKRNQGVAQLKQLNLSSTQQAQLETLKKEHRAALQTLKRQQDITVKQQRDQRYSLRKSHKAAVENLLLPEQKAKLTSMKADAQQRYQAKAAKKMAHLKTKLQLTDAQMNTIEKNRAGIKTQLAALKQNESLDRSAKQAELKRLKTQMQTNMNQVLTAEQRNQFDKMHAERQQKMRRHHGKGLQNRRAEMVK